MHDDATCCENSATSSPVQERVSCACALMHSVMRRACTHVARTSLPNDSLTDLLPPTTLVISRMFSALNFGVLRFSIRLCQESLRS